MLKQCLQIIAEKGLQGLEYSELLEILSYNVLWGGNVKCPIFRDKLWSHIRKLESVFFYCPHIDQSTENILFDKPRNVVEDGARNVRGYCRFYEKMKRVDVKKDLSYCDIVERYPDIHVSTVQELRNEIYIRDTTHTIISDLNTNQFAVYEYYRRVGKQGFTSKDLQQAFQCKAPAIVFYMELLERMGAVKMLVTVKSAGKQVNREHYWFHHSHHDSVRCLADILSSVMTLVNSRRVSSLENLRDVFDEATSTAKLVDHIEETFKLVKHFLLKLAILQPTEHDKFTVRKEVAITVEKKEIDLETETESSLIFYGDALVSGEPLEYQVLHLIESKGEEGISGNAVSAHFGIDHLLFRIIAKSMMSNGLVTTVSRVSKKTSQYMYVMKKFLKSSQESSDHKPQDDKDNRTEKKPDFSNLHHLPTNIERLEAIYRVFQKQKVLSRPEIRKFLRAEPKGSYLSEIDGKTLLRILNSLCKEGKITHLVLKGSRPEDKSLDMFYIPECDKEELDRKVSIIKSRLERPQAHEAMEGLSHVYLSAYKQFPNGIPETFEAFGDYTSPGVYQGPKAFFIQQFHLMLSVLIHLWPISAILPSQLMHLKDWWEYVLTLDPVSCREDGMYEVLDLINHFPIYFLEYFNKKMVFDNFVEVMEHKTYSRYCIGQLPNYLIVSLSSNIMHIVNSMAKVVELLEAMDLVDIVQRFDFTKKSLTGFKFSLRKSTLLLNTAYAPINKHVFRGYNLRRIHEPRRILVFKVSDLEGFIEFWSTAKAICLAGTFHDSFAFCRNISEPAKSLGQVFKDHDIPLDQTEQFYNSPGTAERLNSIYTQLGPGGFLVRLMLNKRDHWCVTIKTSQKPFRPDLAIGNALRPQDSSSMVKDESYQRDDSDSDDYTVHKARAGREKRSIKKAPRKVPVKSPVKPPIALKTVPTGIIRKRNTSVSDHPVAKRIKKKYRDDIDKKINALKITERVKFSENEDDAIIIWSVCLKLFNQPHCPNETRNVLHNYCPEDAADKTVESTKKRRALLLERPEILSRMVDLQAKGTAFKDITTPKIESAKELFDQKEEWVTDLFMVRTILPASFSEFIKNNDIKTQGTEVANHLIVFLTEGYRNKRIHNFKSCKVSSIWNNTQLSDYHKQIYSILMLAVGTQSLQHNEAAFKVLGSLNQEDMTMMSDYMYKHHIIRRQKRKVADDGNVIETQKVAVSSDVLQCLYSPFPDEIITELSCSTEDLTEVHYSDLTPKLVHSVSQVHLKNYGKIIISGSIDPFIESKKSEVVFQNIDTEDATFSEVHTKRNTFFSGIATVEEGAALGFQLSEKHISGRLNYKVHTANEDDKVEGYEDLLGIKENSWPLPLKIFLSLSNSKGSFSWKSTDFGSRDSVVTDSVHMTGASGTTELNSYELNAACLKNMSLPGGDTNLFAAFCQKTGSVDLITPGKDLLNQVFKSKDVGIAESLLIQRIVENHKIPENKVIEIMETCVNIEVVVRVGYTENLIVGRQYSAPWLVSLQCGSVRDVKTSTKKTDKEKDPEEKLETDFTKYFPLTAKPWRTINSDINLPLLRKLLKSIVLFIYAYPGSSKELIDRRYHTYLSPISSKELLGSLIYSDIIKRCLDKPPAATLFSSTTPQIRMHRHMTSASCFRVTDDGLNNLASFL